MDRAKLRGIYAMEREAAEAAERLAVKNPGVEYYHRQESPFAVWEVRRKVEMGINRDKQDIQD